MMARSGNFGKLRRGALGTFKSLFGELVRDARTRRGLTQPDVARLVYNDEEQYSRVSDVERGRNEPRSDTINRFCEALQISYDEVESLRQLSEPFPSVVSPGLGSDRTVFGRKRDVGKIAEMLGLPKAGSVSGLVLKGPPGVGKTTLARSYVQQFASRYEGVWWIHAESGERIIDDLCGLAAIFGISDQGAGREALARAAIVKLQRNRHPWLLVYDNVPSADHVRRWRPETGTIHLLFTSQEGRWPQPYVVKNVQVLALPDAVKLLVKESHRTDNLGEVEGLAEELDCLPLALVNAAAWLRDTPKTGIEQYRSRLSEHLDDEPDGLDGYSNSVFRAIRLSLEKLSERAASLMKILAFVAPDSLSPELFFSLSQTGGGRDYCGAIPSPVCVFLQPPQVEQGFAELTRRSLLDGSEGSFRVHRLTQATQRTVLGDTRNEWCSIAAAVIASGYPEDAFKIENWPAAAVRNHHVDALRKLAGGPPACAAMQHLYREASGYFWEQRADRQALLYAIGDLRMALSRELGANHEEVAQAYASVAIELSRARRHRLAEKFASEAVRITLKSTGIPSSDRSTTLSTYGYILNEWATDAHGEIQSGLFAQARLVLHAALRIHRLNRELPRRALAIRINNLAYLHDRQCRLGAASVLHRTALAIRRSVLQANDPEIAGSLHHLGLLELKRGNMLNALSLLREALLINEDAFEWAPRHPRRIASALRLAAVAVIADEALEAKSVAERYSEDISFLMVTQEASRLASLSSSKE